MTSKKIEKLLGILRAQNISNKQILEAIANVPREKFIDEALKYRAWEDVALPIGQGQTISQPYIVARMTELLELTSTSRVLEIGTGSGYQTAILAYLVQQVYSIERIKILQQQAICRLKQLHLSNILACYGDGWQGWQEYAPFDAIIVTAASSEIPTSLLTQLSNYGILVLPVGNKQQLLKRVRRYKKQYIIDVIEPVYFVSLVTGKLA